jgi:hypothetical protein
VYTWTDENGRLHITDTPPPQSANIKEVMPYKKKTAEEIQDRQERQEQEKVEDLKEKKAQEIEEAKRKARQADQRAQESIARAQKITSDAEAYVRRLSSTKEKRKQFRKKILKIKQQTEATQAEAKAVLEQARQAAEAVQQLEEEAAAAQKSEAEATAEQKPEEEATAAQNQIRE